MFENLTWQLTYWLAFVTKGPFKKYPQMNDLAVSIQIC